MSIVRFITNSKKIKVSVKELSCKKPDIREKALDDLVLVFIMRIKG